MNKHTVRDFVIAWTVTPILAGAVAVAAYALRHNTTTLRSLNRSLNRSLKMNTYFLVFAIAFALNIVWENAHMSLYTGYRGEHSLISRFIRSISDAAGDAIFIIAVYALLSWAAYLSAWLDHAPLTQYFIAGLIGAIWATLTEKLALATGRWQYSSSMPIVPLLKIGLSPLAQLIVLPGLTFWLARTIS